MISALQARDVVLTTVPMIQPADPFLDTAGEDLRRRIYMTSSETGDTLCLRPEFTIPLCLADLACPQGGHRRYGYFGQVFRQRRNGANEFDQAGIEDLGNADAIAADAQIIQDASTIMTSMLPETNLQLTLGDQAIFEAVLAALDLPLGWHARFVHAFGDDTQIDALMSRLTNSDNLKALSPRILTHIEARDEQRLCAAIEAEMQTKGYVSGAGRLAADIARRLIEKAELAETKVDVAAIDALRKFLAIEVDLARASEALSTFADALNLKLGSAFENFEARAQRLENLQQANIDVTYRACFGRPLDYYTGMVFEISQKDDPSVLVGGGRYDRLMSMLGSLTPVPAVGFALWADRIQQKLEPVGEGS